MLDDHLQDTISRYAPYKSWPEYRIAGLLDQYGLPFLYEKPTAVVDAGKVRLWYPDFTLSYGPAIEYFGVNGDDAYRRRTQHKLAVYQENQLTVLRVHLRNLGRSWQDFLLHRIGPGCISAAGVVASVVRNSNHSTRREKAQPADFSIALKRPDFLERDS